MAQPHSRDSSTTRPTCKECNECRQLADYVLSEIHQEENLHRGQNLTVMIDGEPQVWVRKQTDDEEMNIVLHRVSKSIIQIVKEKRTTSVKDMFTHPKRR